MEPVVQFDPERCVLVLGPQLTAASLALKDGVPVALSYKALIEAGVQKTLELETFHSNEEKQRKQTLLANAYELDPAFVGSYMVEALKTVGIYDQWLLEVFSSLHNSPVQRGTSSVVDQLLVLQEKGALLVYTYYDTILDQAMGTAPILLESEENVHNWALRRTQGLLHVHGVYSRPQSVCCDCVNYNKLVGDSKGGNILRDVCKTRSVLFLGFGSRFYDPFLAKFASTFICSIQTYMPSIVLSSSGKLLNHPALMMLKTSHTENLDKVLLPKPLLRPGATRESSIDSSKRLNITLLYNDKSSCSEAADRVKTIPAINVHQLTMKHEQTHHQLLLFLDREGLRSLWKVLFSGDTPSSLHGGLLGVIVDSNVMVWLKSSHRGPASGAVTELTAVHHDISSHPSLSLPSHHHTSHTPPSLTTNVSVINAMYAPIASPSVSPHQAQSKQLSLSPSTRPTLPSPLICSTSRTSLGVTTRSQQLTPELPRHVGLLSPYRKPHGQVRRVQSEHDKLSYQDRLKQTPSIQRNGVLQHRESAPDFVYTSEGLVVHHSDQHNRNIPKINSVSHPSPLVKDGSNLELKIEYIDQYQHGGTAAGTGSGSGKNSGSKVIPAHGSGHKKSDGVGKEGENFNMAKQKFIMDAMNWSNKLDIRKRSNSSSSGQPPLKFVPGGSKLELGSFTSKQSPSPSLLNSNISPEEQEKILQQHFEAVQTQSKSLLQSTSSQSKLSLSPVSGGGVQYHPTPPPGGAHSPSRLSQKANLSPLQLPTTTESPKKSPLNPFILGGQQLGASAGGVTAGGVFSNFHPNASNSSPANFLCSPSVSQFAMFNPFQAALQFLGSPQPNKPMVVTDPAIVQKLQLNISEKLPVIMPDGSITYISANAFTNQLGNNLPETPASTTIVKDEKRDETMKSPRNKNKRQRTLEMDKDVKLIMPKRRRSNSLPDITQLSQQPSFDQQQEAIKEETESAVFKMKNPLQQLPKEPRPRQNPPPNMIQIPQEIRMNDPMLGFPTPPQSSPLIGGFGLSPFVLSSPAFQAPTPMTPMTPSQETLNGEELRELVEASGAQTPLPPSPEGTVLPPFPAGRGPIQLWQFLLDLLLSPDKQNLIQWTGNGYEFRILQPEEIAKLWGARKNKPRMNYDKLSRGLRYYYSKGIMDKVPGKKLTFKYTCDVQHYVRSRGTTTTPTVRPTFGKLGSSTSLDVASPEAMSVSVDATVSNANLESTEEDGMAVHRSRTGTAGTGGGGSGSDTEFCKT